MFNLLLNFNSLLFRNMLWIILPIYMCRCQKKEKQNEANLCKICCIIIFDSFGLWIWQYYFENSLEASHLFGACNLCNAVGTWTINLSSIRHFIIINLNGISWPMFSVYLCLNWFKDKVVWVFLNNHSSIWVLLTHSHSYTCAHAHTITQLVSCYMAKGEEVGIQL